MGIKPANNRVISRIAKRTQDNFVLMTHRFFIRISGSLTGFMFQARCVAAAASKWFVLNVAIGLEAVS